MIRAVLSNPSHPEYGVATIPFPIPHDQYAHCMELLDALEIGDAVKADCKVQAIDSFYSVLKRTEMLTVNVEELNYLAKRLDGFDIGEAAQFQAMAHKLELFELKDLINLTFCCQQATVITDFSDLAAVGRNHYMNLHGGSARVDELASLDGEETARQLIENGNGAVTPYGVVYDNGMKLEQVYDGHFFPCYYYEPNAITVAVTAKNESRDTGHITSPRFATAEEQLHKLLELLDGRELTSAGHLTAQNFSFSDEIMMDDGKLNFYIETNFDADAAFGTFVCTDENDDWLNIYADYDIAQGRPCDTLELNLCKGDGTEENWRYHLNAAEQEVLARKMEEYCQQQNGMSLHDFARQLQEEPGPSPQIEM